MDATNNIAESDASKLKKSSLSNENNSEEPTLSKRKRKKLAKRLQWLEQKSTRRKKEKEKRKLKIQEAAAAGKSLGPSRKLLKSTKMADSPCKLKICFDLSLAHLMTSDELAKTLKQLHRCYAINRRATAPLQLYVNGFADSVKQHMMTKTGCFNWDVNISQESYCEIFDRSSVIYLSSDSPNILETLDYDKVYIIGALVDHNRLKNVCYEKAVGEDVGHASLPLDKYFKFKTRKVLTIDQVYSIFLRLSEGCSWVDAIMQIVPKRKGIEPKGNISVDGENDGEGDINLKSTDSESNIFCIQDEV